MRYLARMSNTSHLMGTNDLENMEIDRWADNLNDMRVGENCYLFIQSCNFFLNEGHFKNNCPEIRYYRFICFFFFKDGRFN